MSHGPLSEIHVEVSKLHRLGGSQPGCLDNCSVARIVINSHQFLPILVNMPLPLSAVIQQHIQQWRQSAAAVVHLVQSAIALYTASEYWSQPYHTSKLTGEEWVWELICGHPNQSLVSIYMFLLHLLLS